MNKEQVPKKNKQIKYLRLYLTIGVFLLMILFLAPIFLNIGYQKALEFRCVIEDVAVMDNTHPVETIFVNDWMKNRHSDDILTWVAPYDKITVRLENGKLFNEIVPCAGSYEVGETLCLYDNEICNYAFGGK